MQEFSLDEVFVAVKIHPEETLLPDIWRRVIEKFMKEDDVPDYCWFRSKSQQWLYFFNRNELNSKLSEARFKRMVEDLQAGIGRFSEWGYAIRQEKKDFLLACTVSGFGKKAKIVDSRVCKVDRSNGRLALVEVSATSKDVGKLMDLMLRG